MCRNSKFILLVQILLFNSCNNEHLRKKTILLNAENKMILQSEFLVVDCGNEIYVYGYLFKSTVNDSSIVGLIRCPDGYGADFFKKNQVYNLQLTNDHIEDSIKGYIPINLYKKYGLPQYLITHITGSK